MWNSAIARAAVAFALGALASATISAYWWSAQHDDPARLRAAFVKNPQLLVNDPDAMAALRAALHERQANADGEARQRLLAQRWAEFTSAARSPSLGNPTAHSTLIEFTDYSCEPCRASATAVRSALEANPDLRVAIMLVPTGGAVSEFAARVAYVAYGRNPLQFARFHELLMSRSARLSQSDILSQAAAAGFDIAQLQAEVASEEVRAYLSEVRRLAEEMRVPGVPTFVSGKRSLSGGASSAQIAELLRSEKTSIAAARQSH